MKKVIILIICFLMIPIIAFADNYDYRIGTKYYNSSNSNSGGNATNIANAKEYKNNDTITILNDNNRDIYLQSNTGAKNITIDLNGKSGVTIILTFPLNISANSDATNEQTTWTIVDSSQNKTGSVTIGAKSTTSNAVLLKSANIILNNVDLSKGYSFDSAGIKDVTLGNCSYNGDELIGSTLVTFSKMSKVVINGGTYNGFKLSNSVNLYITNGNFNGVKIDNAASGNMTINGGTFIASIADSIAYIINNAGTLNINNGNFTLYADNFIQNGNGTVTISGGTVNGECQLFTNTTGTVTMTDGTFNIKKEPASDCKGKTTFFNTGGTVNLNGGTITADGVLFSNSSILNINGGTLKTTTEENAFISTGESVINLNGGTIEARKAVQVVFQNLVIGKNALSTSDPLLDIRSADSFGPVSTGGKAKFYFYKGTLIVHDKLDEEKIRVMYPTTTDSFKIQYERYKNDSYKATIVATSTPDPNDTDNYVLGDWNLDKEFDIRDLALYRDYLALKDPDISLEGVTGTKKYNQLEEKHRFYLDINDDNELDLADLVQARLELAKKTNQ